MTQVDSFNLLNQCFRSPRLESTFVCSKGAVYGMERGLLNLGFSLGPLVGGSIYQDSLGCPAEIVSEIMSMLGLELGN